MTLALSLSLIAVTSLVSRRPMLVAPTVSSESHVEEVMPEEGEVLTAEEVAFLVHGDGDATVIFDGDSLQPTESAMGYHYFTPEAIGEGVHHATVLHDGRKRSVTFYVTEV